MKVTNQDIIFILFFSFVLTLFQTNLTKLEDPIKQVASKVPVQIPVTTVITCKQKSDWCENQDRGSNGPIRKESLFGVENRALETQLLPGDTDCSNYEARLQWGENR